MRVACCCVRSRCKGPPPSGANAPVPRAMLTTRKRKLLRGSGQAKKRVVEEALPEEGDDGGAAMDDDAADEAERRRRAGGDASSGEEQPDDESAAQKRLRLGERSPNALDMSGRNAVAFAWRTCWRAQEAHARRPRGQGVRARPAWPKCHRAALLRGRSPAQAAEPVRRHAPAAVPVSCLSLCSRSPAAKRPWAAASRRERPHFLFIRPPRLGPSTASA